LRIRITEIFYSLQGESTFVGLPTVFVRLTGCPLRCQYCDTEYAFQGGEWQAIDAILDTVAKYKTKYVTVTGGEPLAQKACGELLTQLCDRGYVVSLETSGALPVKNVDNRVIKVMDLKTPGSTELNKNEWDNLSYLTEKDQLKFVICDHADYLWAKQQIEQRGLLNKCEILFSPSASQLNPTELANWILQDQLAVRYQLQIHKILWSDEPGH